MVAVCNKYVLTGAAIRLTIWNGRVVNRFRSRTRRGFVRFTVIATCLRLQIIFPGFMILSGSRACLIVFIIEIFVDDA